MVIKRIFRLVSMGNRQQFMMMFMVLAVCLLGGCGQAPREMKCDNDVINADGDEHEEMAENLLDSGTPSWLPDSGTSSGFPDNDTIRDSIYRYYNREDDEKISEKEVAAVKGKLPGYFLTIRSGEEFALMREWYDWDTVQNVYLYFSEDLREWQEEDLRALKVLEEVCIESDAGTFPVRVLTYLTGVEKLRFSGSTDLSDVTGTLPEGACFPKQVKSVELFRYREGKYTELLRILGDSQVESVTVIKDDKEENAQRFWLDDVACIGTLKELVLDNIVIRVREEASLDGCGLVRIEGHIDHDTELCFVEKLTQLKEVTGRIVAERDLSPLICRKELSLYLEFYKEIPGSDEADYGDGNYTVCPDFNRMVSLPEETQGNGFLGIYQRREDQGRVAECFIIDQFSRAGDEEAGVRWCGTKPCLRITDGSVVYELWPGEYGINIDAAGNRMTFEDINFDGAKDITLEAGGSGYMQFARNKHGWIWDPSSGRYEFSPTFFEINNPVIDSEHQLVHGSWRNWAESSSWAIYQYVDGAFVMQGMLTEEVVFADDIPEDLEVPEGAEVWRWQEEIMENGEVAEVKKFYAVSLEGEEVVRPEACECYYARDSYWREEEGNFQEKETGNLSDSGTSSWLPDNDTIRESIYHHYNREEHEKVSEKEAAAVKGKLPAYYLTVRNGEEFALMREWYDWETVHNVTVYFSRDLEEWQEEDLRALKALDDTVCVESDSDTFPARALTYLTGAKEVHLFTRTDVSDVTGNLPENACFLSQIKAVSLYGYREGKYANLLRLLEDSQVETLTIRPDAGVESPQGFWLDDVAQTGTLKELVLENMVIRVREEASLEGCGLVQIEGFIDQDTDLCFVEKLAQLKEVTSRIVDERDLSPLLQRKGLSLYLEFYKKTSGFEEEDYGGSNFTVCPDFNRMVSLSLEGDDQFLGIYQRREDQGRVAECFVTEQYPESSAGEGELYLADKAPWIRVTDGSDVYELRPEEGLAFEVGIRNRMRFEDINFDGVKDIVLVAGYFGNQGLCYEFGWIWDQKSGRYVFSPTYSMIGNPSIDSRHQLVRSSWRNWAASHSWAIYRYVDGAFVMQGRLTEEPLDGDEIPAELEVPEDAEVWRWQEEIMENGEVAEVRNSYAVSVEGEETVYPEVHESYYAEDSYWGDRN